MFLLLVLLASPQAAAAPAADEYEEVVVTATAGRVALIFDKGRDGRLRNCRVFVSSGVRTVDAKACAALPDCITASTGEEYCGDGSAGASLLAIDPKVKSDTPPTFGLGKLLKPEPPKIPAVGPLVLTPREDAPDRLGKLPPPPKDESGTPAIRLGDGVKAEEPR